MNYFEDFEVGDTFTTRRRTITEADIVLFASVSADWYPLHVDKEYAAASPFGERIAHGMLVLSAATGLFPLTDMAIVAFYGMDRVRFVRPTMIGDTIRCEVEIAEKQDKGPKGGIVAFKTRVTNQHNDAVAALDMKLLIEKKR